MLWWVVFMLVMDSSVFCLSCMSIVSCYDCHHDYYCIFTRIIYTVSMISIVMSIILLTGLVTVMHYFSWFIVYFLVSSSHHVHIIIRGFVILSLFVCVESCDISIISTISNSLAIFHDFCLFCRLHGYHDS